jgi:hypothetical protein
MDEWDTLANTLGFRNEKHLFDYLYHIEHMSLDMIANRLGVGKATVARRLSLLGIAKRTRGGANNLSKQRWLLHLLDQRFVFQNTSTKLAKLIHTDPSTVWKYRYGRKAISDEALREIADYGLDPSSDVTQSTNKE